MKPITATSQQQGMSARQISDYYQELERMLDRVERSTTYYQILNIERSASLDEVRLAYQELTALLFPSYKVSIAIPGQTLSRIARAFERASRAFATLALASRRSEYDRALPGEESNAEMRSSATRASKSAAVSSAERKPEKIPASGSNRRRGERFELVLPVHITGYNRKNGKWQEMAETIDVSRSGITLQLSSRVQHGNVVYVALPMPEKLRLNNHTAPSYNLYAIVRRVGRLKNGTRRVGLEFVGEHPPAGYLEKPWVLFKTKPWSGAERRRKPRKKQTELVSIEYFNEAMQLIAKGNARTEDISLTGLRILVKQAPQDFELVRVSCISRGFESFATLCNRSFGKDGHERISLEFIDSLWPL